MGASVLCLCEKGDAMIMEETGKIFKKEKEMKKGEAWPEAPAVLGRAAGPRGWQRCPDPHRHQEFACPRKALLTPILHRWWFQPPSACPSHPHAVHSCSRRHVLPWGTHGGLSPGCAACGGSLRVSPCPGAGCRGAGRAAAGQTVPWAPCGPRPHGVGCVTAWGPTLGLLVSRVSLFPLTGIAFPTSISVNNCVCHFSPLKSDQDYILKDGDLVKM